MGEPSVLDERLAEIDRRLRAIQSGLEPEEAPPEPPRIIPTDLRASARQADAAPPADVAPAPGPALELVAGLRDLLDFHQRLLTSTAELLETYADALSQAPAAPQAPPATPPPTALHPQQAVSELTEVSLSAGPLSSTEALRDFERALSELAQVRNVAVREFEGENRVVVDLHLARPTS
jgi:hypothetical protein